MSGRYTLHVGDARAVLDTLPADSFDALLCDPPYALVGSSGKGGFMGKKWDAALPSVDMWRAALRVLKPGAPLLAFGGTRTFHRLAVAIEDAGFEIRDCIGYAWVYGSGFPKSLDVSKAIDAAAGAERTVLGMGAAQCEYIARGERCPGHGDAGRYGETVHAALTAPATPLAAQWQGYGTALKPAWEPCILARKPLDGTVANNVQRWGVGGLAIVAPVGRWPANVILDEAAAAQLDAEAGDSGSRRAGVYGHMGYNGNGRQQMPAVEGDSGGASRFFYCAKVSAAERELGCEALPLRDFCQGYAGDTDASPDRDGDIGMNRIKRIRNGHPTLKPVALTRYLARLVLPPPGRERRIVVPFAGAASEMIGALLAGWEHVEGVELSEEYATIARARLKVAIDRPGAFDAEARATVPAEDMRQGSLFG